MGISISLDSVARKKAWHPTRDVRAHTSDTTCAHFLMNLDQKEKNPAMFKLALLRFLQEIIVLMCALWKCNRFLDRFFHRSSIEI